MKKNEMDAEIDWYCAYVTGVKYGKHGGEYMWGDNKYKQER